MKTPAFLLAKIMCDKNTSEWLSELQPKTLVRGPKYHSVSILELKFQNKYTYVFWWDSFFNYIHIWKFPSRMPFSWKMCRFGFYLVKYKLLLGHSVYIYSNWTLSSFLDLNKKYVVIFTAASLLLLLCRDKEPGLHRNQMYSTVQCNFFFHHLISIKIVLWKKDKCLRLNKKKTNSILGSLYFHEIIESSHCNVDTVKVVQYASGSLKDQDCLSNMTFNFGIMQHLSMYFISYWTNLLTWTTLEIKL